MESQLPTTTVDTTRGETAPLPGASTTAEAQLVRDVHRIVDDLLRPSPRVFWSDFLITAIVAYTALGLYLVAPDWSVVQLVCLPVAALAIYRGSVFTHELVHVRRGSFGVFRVAWNLGFGVPCMMPSFLYYDHTSHHVNHSYGTAADGEYYPFGRGPVGLIYLYLLHILVIPVAAVVRLVLLTPMCWLVPPLRRGVWERASSLAMINPNYRRPQPERGQRLAVVLQEAGCFAVGAGLLIALLAGWVSWLVLAKLYVVFLLVVTVNYVRALGAHRYLSPGTPLTYIEQLLDSTTVPGHPLLTELWAPLGMRYHALHHLIPSLPYHAMGRAHRRLMDRLPADSPYRATLRSSLWAALCDVFREAKAPHGATISA